MTDLLNPLLFFSLKPMAFRRRSEPETNDAARKIKKSSYNLTYENNKFNHGKEMSH